MIDVPFDVKRHGSITVKFEGASYVIEKLTWQALPGLYLPAVLYKPVAAQQRRSPVVLSPSACGEGAFVHTPGQTSVQRRLANFALAGMIAFYTDGFCQSGESQGLGKPNLIVLLDVRSVSLTLVQLGVSDVAYCSEPSEVFETLNGLLKRPHLHHILPRKRYWVGDQLEDSLYRLSSDSNQNRALNGWNQPPIPGPI